MGNMQNIERRIVSLVTKLTEGRSRLLQLHLQIIDIQTALANMIEEYGKELGKDSIDDLFSAIIDDQALEQKDIMIVFDLTEVQYRAALKRYFERKDKKST